MNEAIKLAIEKGGYPSVVTADYYYHTDEGRRETRLLTLDPLFWQALGKALGWTDDNFYGSDWEIMAHDYLGVVLRGGNTEKFWKDLLKPSDA